ncbi:MAG: Fic family protein [Pseudobdellovibrionaceae bacterium]
MTRSWLLLSLVSLAVSLSEAQSASLCRQVHQKATAKSSGALLDAKKLAQEGFLITDGGDLYDTRLNRKMGSIRRLNVPNLYEWAQPPLQKIWVQNGGLSKTDLDAYIDGKGQNFGRGYYVSTHPTDSMSYGDAVTIFKPSGPMTALVYTQDLYKADAIFYRRLQRAGLDAILIGETWLAVINSRHLKVERGEIQDPQLNDLNSLGFIVRLQKSGFAEHLSAGNPNRLLAEQMTGEGLKQALASEDPTFLQKISEVDSWIDKPQVQKIFSPTEEFSLRSIFPYFDIATTLQVLKKGTPELKNLKSVSDFTQLMMKNRAKIDLHKVRNFKEFAKLAVDYTGQKSEIRDYAVMMSSVTAKGDNGIANPPDKFYKNIRRNILLSITPSSPGRIHVEYLSLPKIQKNFSQFLSTSLQKRLSKLAEDYDLEHPGLYRLKEAQILLQESLTELTDILFTGTPEQQATFLGRALAIPASPQFFTPYHYYQAFMAIHPLTDANGRMGRLFFEWLHRNSKGPLSVLELADFDMDVFMPAENLKQLHITTRVLNTWIARSQDQKELQARLEQSKAYLANRFIEMGQYWKAEGYK